MTIKLNKCILAEHKSIVNSLFVTESGHIRPVKTLSGNGAQSSTSEALIDSVTNPETGRYNNGHLTNRTRRNDACKIEEDIGEIGVEKGYVLPHTSKTFAAVVMQLPTPAAAMEYDASR